MFKVAQGPLQLSMLARRHQQKSDHLLSFLIWMSFTHGCQTLIFSPITSSSCIQLVEYPISLTQKAMLAMDVSHHIH